MTRCVLPAPIARPTRAVSNGWAPESSSPLTAMTCVRSSTDSSVTEKVTVPLLVDGVCPLSRGIPVLGGDIARANALAGARSACRGPASRWGASWRHTEARAVQTSPDGLVARAGMRSVPAPWAGRGRTSKEPLGAGVVAVVAATRLPLRLRVTRQRTPLRFWSTSNSASRRLSSGLTLSLADEDFVQLPRALASSSPPCLARAVVGASAAAARTAVRVRMLVFVMAGTFNLGRWEPQCDIGRMGTGTPRPRGWPHREWSLASHRPGGRALHARHARRDHRRRGRRLLRAALGDDQRGRAQHARPGAGAGKARRVGRPDRRRAARRQ